MRRPQGLITLAVIFSLTFTAVAQVRSYEANFSTPATINAIDPVTGLATTPPEFSNCAFDPPNVVFGVNFTSGFSYGGIGGLSQLYGLEWEGGSGPDIFLYRMNAGGCATGIRIGTQPVGFTNLESLAYCSDDGFFYSTDFIFDAHQGRLIRIDPATGVGAAVGNPLPTDVRVLGMTYHPGDHRLYAVTAAHASRPDDELWRIDPASGEAELVGPTGLPDGSVESATLSGTSPSPPPFLRTGPQQSGGPLHLIAAGTNTYELNQNTGAATLVGGNYAATQWAMAAPQPEVSAMTPTLIFPQFVNGEVEVADDNLSPQVLVPNRSRIILINNSNEPDSGVVNFQNAAGAPSPIPMGGGDISSVPYNLGSWSTTDFETDGTGGLQTGVIEVVSDRGEESQIEGTEAFDILGRFVSVSSSTPAASGRAYVSVDAVEGTGVAVYNPDRGMSITLTFTLRDSDGVQQATRDVVIDAGRQLVRFVNEAELFADFFSTVNGRFEGTLEITSDGDKPFALLGLLQKLTTGALIAAPVVENTTSPGRLIFPQFVNGEVLVDQQLVPNKTRIILIDPTNDEGNILFRDDKGAANPIPIGGVSTSNVAFDTAAGGSAEIETDGTGSLKTGTIEVVSEFVAASKLIALEAFDVLGNFVSVPSALLDDCQQTYVSVEAGSENAGVALYNPDDTDTITLELLLVDSGGTKRAFKQQVELAPQNQLVGFVNEAKFFKDFFDGLGADFRGTLNIRSTDGSPFAVVGLLQKFTTGALVAIAPSLNAYKGCTDFGLP